MSRSLLVAVVLLAACGGPDEDGDGVGAAKDCDDGDVTVFPGADELCDGVDNDCDGGVDDEDPEGPRGTGTFYADEDGDEFGGTSLGRLCSPPPTAVRTGGDCDDADASVNPDAAEVCNGADDDCDELIDDADDSLDATSGTPFYADVDEDGYGSAANFVNACELPSGYVDDATDCDDADEERNPGHPEVCDGKDNNCDVATGLRVDDDDPDLDMSTVETSYLDEDLDGYGIPDTTFELCNPPANTAPNSDDCDDDNDDVNPGVTEVCDGIDNNCDGFKDADEWWDTRWTYRRIFTVTGGDADVEAPIVAVDLDAAGLLDLLGDSTDLTPDGVRVVTQNCASAQVEIPSEFLEDHVGLLAAGDDGSPSSDGEGTLVFRYDEDGNVATRETLADGEVRRFAVYFSSTDTAATAPTPRPALPDITLATTGPAGDFTTVSVSSGLAELELNALAGGLVSDLRSVGRDSTGAQTANVFGNGVYFGPTGGGPTGGWVSGVLDDQASLTVVHRGPLVAIVDADGVGSNGHGALAYRYRYLMFQGRPEVYAKVRYETTAASHVGPQATTWSQAVRPWQIDNLALRNAVGGSGSRDPGYRWVHGAYDTDSFGVWMGWVTPALSLANPVADTDGRYLALAGQDVEDPTVSNEKDIASGTMLLDDPVIVVWPHAGSTASTQPTFLELLQPRGVTWGGYTAYVAP